MSDERLLLPDAVSFWSEHSDRAGVDSWLGALSVGADLRRFVGRWAIQSSEDTYVRIANRITENCQRFAARHAKAQFRGGPDYLGEEETLEQLRSYLSAMRHEEEAVNEQIAKLTVADNSLPPDPIGSISAVGSLLEPTDLADDHSVSSAIVVVQEAVPAVAAEVEFPPCRRRGGGRASGGRGGPPAAACFAGRLRHGAADRVRREQDQERCLPPSPLCGGLLPDARRALQVLRELWPGHPAGRGVQRQVQGLLPSGHAPGFERRGGRRGLGQRRFGQQRLFGGRGLGGGGIARRSTRLTLLCMRASLSFVVSLCMVGSHWEKWRGRYDSREQLERR